MWFMFVQSHFLVVVEIVLIKTKQQKNHLTLTSDTSLTTGNITILHEVHEEGFSTKKDKPLSPETLPLKPVKKKPYTPLEKSSLAYEKSKSIKDLDLHPVIFDFNLGDLEDLEHEAFNAYDSSGRYRGQIYFGNDKWLGQKQNCYELNRQLDPEQRKHFEFEFFTALMAFNLSLPEILHFQLQVGECLPKSCTALYVQHIIEMDPHGQILKSLNATQVKTLRVRTVPGIYSYWRELRFQIFASFLITLVLLVLVATWFQAKLTQCQLNPTSIAVISGSTVDQTPVIHHISRENGKSFELYQMSSLNENNNVVDMEMEVNGKKSSASQTHYSLPQQDINANGNGFPGPVHDVEYRIETICNTEAGGTYEVKQPLGLHEQLLLCFTFQTNASSIMSIDQQKDCVFSEMLFSKMLQSKKIYNSMDISNFFLKKSVKISALCLLSIMPAYLFYKWREGPYYSQPHRLDGKVAIVTGCNMGIGKEIALDLARRGARVYMACRNFDKCEEALREIVSLTGNPNVFNCSLDLSSLESIRKFVENFKKEENHLDILINNAGILGTPHALTEEGFELQFGVNHLGHFLLTNLLLDHLKASKSGRIVVLTSIAHFMGSINKQDLNSCYNYNKFAAYAQSKLANVLFTRQLAKLLNGSSITVNCLHPGIVRTQIFRHDPFTKILTSLASRIFLRSIKGGAQTALYLAIDPQIQGKSGDYYDRMKVSRMAAKAKDDEMAEWLWKESEKLVGLRKENQEK